MASTMFGVMGEKNLYNFCFVVLLYITLVRLCYASYCAECPNTCPSFPKCLGDRIPRKNCCGCYVCPGQIGDGCGPAYGRHCDEYEDTGLVCGQDSRCTGPYNLTLLSVGATNIKVSWIYASKEIYSWDILYSHSYSVHKSSWKTQKPTLLAKEGLRVVGTVKDLKSDSVYFVRISAIDAAGSVASTSEVLLFRTLGLCHYYDKWYPVGTTLFPGCTVRCECKTDKHGVPRMTCGDRCWRQAPPPNGNKKCMQVSDPANHCCHLYNCSSDDGRCFYRNKFFKHGDKWSPTCGTTCHCYNGNVKCTSVCPTLPVTDKQGCRRYLLMRKPEECCPRFVCFNTTANGIVDFPHCFHEGRVRTSGKSFRSSNCQLCRCSNNGVLCENKSCSDGSVYNSPQSELCPHPQVVKGQCCNILSCHTLNSDNPNQPQKLTAWARSPTAIMIEFFPPKNMGLNQIMEGYDVFYKNASEEMDVWQKRFISKNNIMVTNKIPNISTFAIHFSDKVRINLPDLQSSVLYKVKVRANVKNEVSRRLLNGDVIPRLSAPSNRFVEQHFEEAMEKVLPYSNIFQVRTFAAGVSCHVDRQIIPHGGIYQRKCWEKCTCQNGKVSCQNKCPALSTTVQTASDCARPQLYVKSGECCPKWRCAPEVGGCVSGHQTYRNGDQWKEACGESCTCLNGRISCRTPCMNANTSRMLRLTCSRVKLPGSCCLTQQCLKDTKPYHLLRLAIKSALRGPCYKKNDLRAAFIALLKSKGACPRHQYPGVSLCTEGQVAFHCDTRRGSPSESHDNARSVAVTAVVEGSTISNIRQTKIYMAAAARKVASVLADNPLVIPGINISYIWDSVIVGDISHFCRSEQLMTDSGCVDVSHIYEGDMDFHALCINITTHEIDVTSAVVSWSRPGEAYVSLLTGFKLSYQPADTKSLNRSVRWPKTELLHSLKTSINLDKLYPDTEYVVTIEAMTKVKTNFQAFKGASTFRTKKNLAPRKVLLSVIIKDVKQSSANIFWELAPPVEQYAKTIYVMYKQKSQGDMKESPPLQNFATWYQLPHLQVSSTYFVQIKVIFVGHGSFISSPIEFRTPGVSTSALTWCEEILIPVSVITSVLFLVSVSLMIVLCCIGCRFRQTRNASWQWLPNAFAKPHSDLTPSTGQESDYGQCSERGASTVSVPHTVINSAEA